MYVVLQAADGLYLIDQHALAERIAFEKMKKLARESGMSPETLLQPVTMEMSKSMVLDEKIEELQKL